MKKTEKKQRRIPKKKKKYIQKKKRKRGGKGGSAFDRREKKKDRSPDKTIFSHCQGERGAGLNVPIKKKKGGESFISRGKKRKNEP